jgi:transposase-like protein
LPPLPKSARPAELAAIKEIYNADRQGPSRDQGLGDRLRRQVPQSAAKFVDDADVLLEFRTYPAEHWIHLRTTNPIEPTIATV